MNNNERLTVLIAGREALPVRAIPFVTGWSLAPVELAAELAQTRKNFTCLKGLIAYHVQDGAPCRVLPKEWDAVEAKIKGFEADTQAQFSDDDKGFAVWYRECVHELPPGVFVWRDEFEAAWSVGMDDESVTILDEREGDRELNYQPILEGIASATVLAGFSNFQTELLAEQARREANASFSVMRDGKAVYPFAAKNEHDPKHQDAEQRAFHLVGRKSVIEDEIRKLELMNAPLPTEHDSKKRQLNELRADLAAVEIEMKGLLSQSGRNIEAQPVAAPAIEGQPVPQEPPPAKTKTATEKHRAALAQFIGKVRAKAPDFDAIHAPGRIADALDAMKAWAKHEGVALSIQSKGTLDRARTGLMAFGRGARKTTFYRDTFPEWFSK